MSKFKKVNVSLTEKRLLNITELMAYTGMGYVRAMEWGKKIGACRRYGKRVFFDRLIVDETITNGMNE